MTLKNLFSKTHTPKLFTEALGRYTWISIVSAVSLILSVILPIFVVAQRYENALAGTRFSYYTLEDFNADILNFLSLGNFISGTVLIILAVVGAVGVFSYLHSSKATDFFHSLPISRKKFFLLNYMVVPAIVIFFYTVVIVLASVITALLGFESCIDVPLILLGWVQSIIFFLLVYSVAVLGVICCGNTLISVLFLAWLYFSPSLWLGILNGYCDGFWKTFVTPDFLEALVYKLSPILGFYNSINQGSTFIWRKFRSFNTEPLNMENMFMALAAFAVISFLCYFLFKIRPSESAGEALAFKKAKTPVKIYMTSMIALGGGLLMTELFEYRSIWMFIGILLGGVILHGVVEAIYALDVRAIFKHLPHLALSLAVALVLAYGIRMDIVGYDTKKVDLEDIQSADFWDYANSSSTNFYNPNHDLDLFEEPEEIEQVWKTANLCVDFIEKNENYHRVSTEPVPVDDESQAEYLNCRVIFHMNNGSTMVRLYHDIENSEAIHMAENLSRNEKYLEKYHTFYDPDLLNFGGTDELGQKIVMFVEPFLSISGSLGDRRNLYSVEDKKQMEEIVEVFREECSAVDVEYLKTHVPELNISIEGRTASVYPVYEKTINLIQKYSGYQKVEFKPEDVRLLKITYFSERNEWGSREDESIYVSDLEDIRQLTKNIVPRSSLYQQEWNLIQAHGAVEYEECDIEIELLDGSCIYDLTYIQGTEPEEILNKYFKQMKGR